MNKQKNYFNKFIPLGPLGPVGPNFFFNKALKFLFFYFFHVLTNTGRSCCSTWTFKFFKFIKLKLKIN